MTEFIQQILNNLESNGFPEKSVSFPTERMYEIADKKSLSLNKVIEVLGEQHQIMGVVGDEKIVFSKKFEEADVDPAEMMKKAQEMMSKMDASELSKMKSLFENMSEEERAQLIQKGRDMGIV